MFVWKPSVKVYRRVEILLAALSCPIVSTGEAAELGDVPFAAAQKSVK